MMDTSVESPEVEHRIEAPRCPVCGAAWSHYGCTNLVCRGLDCD